MRWIILIVLFALGAGYWLGRRSPEDLRETFFPVSPHERYYQSLVASGLGRAALGREWGRAAGEALQRAPVLSIPFRETGYLDPREPDAVGYRFDARAGQRVRVEFELEPATTARVFLDLFQLSADSADPADHVANADSGATTIEYEPRRDAQFIVRLQPELLRGGRYTLTVTTEPTLAFPLDGIGTQGIRSFYGDPREGGSRDHHGIDIFAPRGTPVLAVAAGEVTSVRTTPRGGNVVWLRDDSGNRLYYAHLDRQLVTRGARVEPGDTLGLVGNTGNARSTPPHLHFGVYRRGRGPLDPLPFVRPESLVAAPPSVAIDVLGGWVRVAADGVRLRAAPSSSADVVDQLDRWVPLLVLGAAGEWYRVRLPDGRVGFIAGRLTEAVRPIRLATGPASLRARPHERAARIADVGADTTLEVLGLFGDFYYVRAGERNGWVAASG